MLVPAFVRAYVLVLVRALVLVLVRVLVLVLVLVLINIYNKRIETGGLPPFL